MVLLLLDVVAIGCFTEDCVVLAGEEQREHERMDDGRERTGSLAVHQTLQRARGQLLEPGVRKRESRMAQFAQCSGNRSFFFWQNSVGHVCVYRAS